MPIMKLLVAVETLIGRPIATSMAGTLSPPLPIPRSPDTVPAPTMRPKPPPGRWGAERRRRPGAGEDGHDAGGDGVPDVDAECGEHGDDESAAAEAQDGTEEAGDHRSHEDGELESWGEAHAVSLAGSGDQMSRHMIMKL